MNSTDDFDWNAVADQVVQYSVEKVAIYDNPNGDVVIRQEQRWDEEEDTFIVIAQGHALRAAHAILTAAGIEAAPTCVQGDGLAEPVLLPAPKDRTAAERMRRYRDKHRNEQRNAVTDEPELRLVNGPDQEQEVLDAAE
jgi:hypothetical protein